MRAHLAPPRLSCFFCTARERVAPNAFYFWCNTLKIAHSMTRWQKPSPLLYHPIRIQRNMACERDGIALLLIAQFKRFSLPSIWSSCFKTQIKARGEATNSLWIHVTPSMGPNTSNATIKNIKDIWLIKSPCFL